MSDDKVVVFVPNDRLEHDPKPLLTIYRNLDPVSADQVVTKAFAEIGLSAATVVSDVMVWDKDKAHRQLKRLQHLAENIGMTSLAHAASEMQTCLQGNDGTAISAVLNRIRRVAERSLQPDMLLSDRSL